MNWNLRLTVRKHISSREELVKDKVSHLVYLNVLEARFLVQIVLKIVQIYLR
jgi:hypothetical protein